MSGRGRGRGRGGRAAPSRATQDDTPTASQSDSDGSSDEPMAAPAGPAGRRLGTGGQGSSARGAVGGLLGMNAQAGASGSGGSGVAAKRFTPNMRRKVKVAGSDDDLDVKMEDTDPFAAKLRAPRGPREAKPRTELAMTASGPMGQGPGGAPKAWGAVKPKAGGIGVMNAARAGTSGSRPRARQADDDTLKEDIDDSDIDEDSEDGNSRVYARELNDIGDEDPMAPMILPRDPKVERKAEARKKERREQRVKKQEERDLPSYVKPEPDDDAMSSMLSSATATPALEDVDMKMPDFKRKAKEEDDNKPIDHNDLRTAFDLDPDEEQIYMFQFPRQFPGFVNADSLDDKDLLDVKEEDGKPGTSKKYRGPPLEWGRMGSRAEKAARWPMEQGRIGELCIHASGKVSMRLNGDLVYDVLPAASPSFLQELAIIDHDPANEPLQPGEKQCQSDPSGQINIMGQTSKKFIVVPEVSHLLEKVAEQEAKEKEREKEAKELAAKLKSNKMKK